MVMLKDIIEAGESLSLVRLTSDAISDFHPPTRAERQGVNTITITAGAISPQPLLLVANLKHDGDYVKLEGLQRVVEVAQACCSLQLYWLVGFSNYFRA